MQSFKTKLLASALGVASIAAPMMYAVPSYAATQSDDSNGARFKSTFGIDPSKNSSFQLTVAEDKKGITVSSYDSATGILSTQPNPSKSSSYRSMASQEMSLAAKIMSYDTEKVSQTAQQVMKNGGTVFVTTNVDANNNMRITVSMQDKQGKKTGYNFRTPLF